MAYVAKFNNGLKNFLTINFFMGKLNNHKSNNYPISCSVLQGTKL